MKRENNPFEGNKRILEDEATYQDHNTLLLINLIVDLVVTTTLTQAQSAECQPIPDRRLQLRAASRFPPEWMAVCDPGGLFDQRRHQTVRAGLPPAGIAEFPDPVVGAISESSAVSIVYPGS